MHSRKRPFCDIKMPTRCAEESGLRDCSGFSRPSPGREFLTGAMRGWFCMMRNSPFDIRDFRKMTVAPVHWQKMRGKGMQTNIWTVKCDIASRLSGQGF